jgi:hypothetical protein
MTASTISKFDASNLQRQQQHVTHTCVALPRLANPATSFKVTLATCSSTIGSSGWYCGGGKGCSERDAQLSRAHTAAAAMPEQE